MTSEGGKKIRPAPGDVQTSPFAPLRPFMQSQEQDVDDGLRKLSAALDDFDMPVRLHVEVLDGSEVQRWNIEGGRGRSSVDRGAAESKADIRVVVRRETWLRIAQGTLSPFDALFAGRLRVGGDTELAKRLVQHLSDPDVPYVPPC